MLLYTAKEELFQQTILNNILHIQCLYIFYHGFPYKFSRHNSRATLSFKYGTHHLFDSGYFCLGVPLFSSCITPIYKFKGKVVHTPVFQTTNPPQNEV